MRVDDLMTKPAIGIAPEAGIAEAARLMVTHRFSGLPVVDAAGKLCGIITEGDLLRRSELGTEARRPQWQEFFTGSGKLAEEFVRSHGRKVGEVMSPEPITIASGAPLDEAVALMLDRKIKRLPVIADGKLVGVIARSDLVRTLIDTLPDGSAAVSSDDQIRAALAEALRGQGWAAMDHMRAEVAGGVVTLEGTILDERQRVALKVVAENTPGVKQVIDHMVWIEPMSGLVLRSPEDRQPGDDDADNKAA